MSDTWCGKARAKNGRVVSGGAARNVRIADAGGMDKILADVAEYAARNAAHAAIKQATALYVNVGKRDLAARKNSFRGLLQ